MALRDHNGVLSWLHVGDLHITREGEQNHRDLLRLVGLMQKLAPGSLDFAVLPGDNADDGTRAQFALVRDAVAPMPFPLHVLPGDHDFKPETLDAFHQVLGVPPLPTSQSWGRHRGLFLDVVSAGTGGPDFRIDDEQLRWVELQLDQAETAGQDVVVFMHTYPADLRAGADRLRRLLARPCVRCVDMGHTHYNELSNDGGTIYMATRSTGQVEEGPPGFSVAALDAGGVSWRFQPLEQAWPLVLITSPVDHRLATEAAATSPTLRAKVIGDAAIATVLCRGDDGPWRPMSPVPSAPNLFQAECPAGRRLEVRAIDSRGRQDADTVEPAGPGWQSRTRHADGSDADRVGAWPERHIFGTQLGPNRNGRKW